jgi:hypothetical protein
VQLIVHVPDELIEGAKGKLPPIETGILEAVALDAILGFLFKLTNSETPTTNPDH